MTDDPNRLLVLKSKLTRLDPQATYDISRPLLFMTMAYLDKRIGREKRLAFLAQVFGREIPTSKALKPHEMAAILEWAKSSKIGEEKSSPWCYSAQFESDLSLLQRILGQIEMAI